MKNALYGFGWCFLVLSFIGLVISCANESIYSQTIAWAIGNTSWLIAGTGLLIAGAIVDSRGKTK